MEAQTQSLTREPVLPTAKVDLRILRVGTSPEVSQKQRNYEQTREMLFNPNIKFSSDLVATTLKAREEELDEAISKAPLKSATDRGGYTLGSLKELTSLAQQELSGEVQAKGVLKRQLEMIIDEEESKVIQDAKNTVYEGVSIDKKTGSIVIQSFPNQDKRDIASDDANRLKQNFLKGKDRLQRFTSELK